MALPISTIEKIDKSALIYCRNTEEITDNWTSFSAIAMRAHAAGATEYATRAQALVDGAKLRH
jgi:hypothetical protein